MSDGKNFRKSWPMAWSDHRIRRMQPYSRTSGTRESRLTFWFKEVGPNVRTLGERIKADTKEAFTEKDPIKLALLPIVEATRVIVDGPNALFGGVIDAKLEYGSDYRTIAEAGATVKNLATLHPLRALNHAWNTLTVWPLDIATAVSGIGHGTRANIARSVRQAA